MTNDPTTPEDRAAMLAMFPPAAGRAALPDPPTNRNIARMFHEAYERLAPEFGYRTREASAVPWEKVPAKNRDLMTATVGKVRSALAAALPDERLREADRAALVESIAQTERFRGGPCLCSDCVEKRADAEATVDAVLAALAAADRDKEEDER